MAGQSDWYADVALDEYEDLYRVCRSLLGGSLPESVLDLGPEDRGILGDAFKRRWPPEVVNVYESFAWSVARASEQRWRAALDSASRREEMVWRLLRLEAVPYFVLGRDVSGEPIRYRIDTPWDFRSRFRLINFDPVPEAAGQPIVRWRAEVAERETSERYITEGHVEIRWSHGRFGGAPEAKIYLDTPHHSVPGYQPLESAADSRPFG
jgi:hypothetical protein